MGFFDRPLFDFNGDGKTDAFEAEVELQMMAGSRQEAIALTGDDTFYTGSDTLEEDEDIIYSGIIDLYIKDAILGSKKVKLGNLWLDREWC